MENVLNVKKCLYFVRDVRMSHYIVFIYNCCCKILSARALSHLGVVAFRHNDLTITRHFLIKFCFRMQISKWQNNSWYYFCTNAKYEQPNVMALQKLYKIKLIQKSKVSQLSIFRIPIFRKTNFRDSILQNLQSK